MLDKTFPITLDTEKELYQGMIPLFTVSRNDFETVDLLFKIMQDDQPVNLAGTSVELAIKKPSGLTVYQQCDISNAGAGEASAKLSIQGYVEYGLHTAEVYLRTGNQLAVTCAFYYSSREAIMETEEVESINDWSALQQALFAYDLKPLLVSGFPINTPEYVGQLAFDIVNRLTYIASDVAAASWQLVGTGDGGGAGAIDTIIGAGIPTAVPARPGQVYIDTGITPHGIYIAGGGTADDWERVDNNDLTAAVAWGEISGKPDVYPAEYHTHTSGDITDFAGAVAGFIPTEYLTETEGDARYLTEAAADDKYVIVGSEPPAAPTAWGDIQGTLTDQADITAALAGKADDGDLAGYAPVDHTHVIGDVAGLDAALAGKADDGDLAGYAPLAHTHAIADVTGLDAALAGKADDSDLAGYAPIDHVHDVADVTGLQAALDAKADDTDLAGYAPVIHTHAIADVTGLQPALDDKANLVDLEGYATYDMVYTKDQVYNKTEVDQMTMGTGGGSPVIVEDNLASTSTTNALSANQGRILNTTKASLNHTHTVANITDFAAGVSANIPAEYLTATEGDARYLTAVPATYQTTAQADVKYAPAGDYLTAVPAEYLTDAEGNAAYAPIDHNHTTADITDFAAGVAANIPAEYVTATEGDAAYAAKAHTHTAANITDFASAVAANIPATYATDAEVAAAYQPKGTYLTAVPLMSGSAIGGAQVGNGLAMSGNYLYAKTGAGLGIAGDNTIQVQTTNTTPAPVRFWTGTQAAYTAITTKDANTLYFISG